MQPPLRRPRPEGGTPLNDIIVELVDHLRRIGTPPRENAVALFFLPPPAESQP